MDLPLGKKSIFGQNKNILLESANRITVPEMSPKTRFGTSKRPATKKYRKRDKVRVIVKQKNLSKGNIFT